MRLARAKGLVNISNFLRVFSLVAKEREREAGLLKKRHSRETEREKKERRKVGRASKLKGNTLRVKGGRGKEGELQARKRTEIEEENQRTRIPSWACVKLYKSEAAADVGDDGGESQNGVVWHCCLNNIKAAILWHGDLHSNHVKHHPPPL